MPSSLVSTANSPSTFSTPAATSGAEAASIGRTGRPTSMLNSSSADSPDGQRGDRDRAGGSAEHGGAADRLHRQLGGGRDRVEHHRVERALPHVAGDQVAQVVLLGRGQPAEQPGHRRPRRAPAEPEPDSTLISSSVRVDLGERHGRGVGRRERDVGEARASPHRCGAGAACRRGTTRRCRSRPPRPPTRSRAAGRRSGHASRGGTAWRRLPSETSTSLASNMPIIVSAAADILCA